MSWSPQYAIDFTASGDETSEAIQKHINEISLVIFPLLNRLRTFDAGPTAPTDPVQYALWLDTSVSPALLKMYSGTEWTTEIHIGQALSAADADKLAGKTYQEVLAGAVAALTFNDIKALLTPNDGAGSGLDADLLDGYHASDLLTDSPMIPNYAARVSRSANTTYTASTDGYLIGYMGGTDRRHSSAIYVNGIQVYSDYTDSGTMQYSFSIPLAYGDTYHIAAPYLSVAYFVPKK